jgi:hypothetical protein
VVVLNWNGRDHLAGLFPSLLASTYSDFFVLVVDNGSQDGSVEWTRREFPSVEVLALGENRRFSGGNNAGAARARELGAELLLILNNDTEVDPECLSWLVESFREDSAIGIVGPRICYHDRPEKIWYGGGRIRRSLGIISHRAIRRGVDEGADPCGATDWVSGCALAVREKVWSSLKGLDEEYYIYAEDVDFCLRAADAGVGIHYEPRALVLHKVSASVGGASSAFKSYHKSRAALRLFARHGAGPGRFSAYCGLAMHDLAAIAWLLARGHFRSAFAILCAWVDAVFGHQSYRVEEALPKG